MAASVKVSKKPLFSALAGIAFDSANNRVLVVERGLGAVLAVSLSSGECTVISDDVTGTGPEFLFPLWSALDNANRRVLVVDIGLNALLVVEPISGDRIIYFK